MWSINLPRMIYFMLESMVVPDKNAILPRPTKTEKRPKGQMKTAHYHLHIFAIERYRRYRSRQVNSLEFRRWTQYVQWPQQSLHKCGLSLQIRFVNHGWRTRDSSNNTQLCSLDPGPDFWFWVFLRDCFAEVCRSSISNLRRCSTNQNEAGEAWLHS